jgi:hypothetical protein
MGWRFRRRVGIVPGVTLNLGKTGASVSVGMRGLHRTFGRVNRTTIGLPGTGLSYTPLALATAAPPPSIQWPQ